MVLCYKVCYMTKYVCYLGNKLKLSILQQIEKSFSFYKILYLGVLNTCCIEIFNSYPLGIRPKKTLCVQITLRK